MAEPEYSKCLHYENGCRIAACKCSWFKEGACIKDGIIIQRDLYYKSKIIINREYDDIKYLT